MYENDSEDEEEDEAEMLQPNPKLEQGESILLCACVQEQRREFDLCDMLVFSALLFLKRLPGLIFGKQRFYFAIEFKFWWVIEIFPWLIDFFLDLLIWKFAKT